MKAAPLVIALIASAAALQGCTVALTAAGVAGGTGVQETLNGIKHKTFGMPVEEVRLATLKSLHRLAMKVDADEKTDTGWQIDASALDRDINITLEAITVRSTRMRVSVNDGDFFFMKDAATGNEIINQTTRVLAENVPAERQTQTASNGPVRPAKAVAAAWPNGPPGPPPRRPPYPQTASAEEGWSPSSLFTWLTDSIQK